MKDTLFIQFYNYNQRFYNYELSNGFSDTYDLCKSYGDFYWVNHKKIKLDQKDFGYDDDFIIDRGTVYASVSFTSHLYQVYLWALRYPNINFIVGGPCIFWGNGYKIIKQLPKNITFIYKTVEEYFGKPNFSYQWKLVPPKDIQQNEVLSYSYSMENVCYWRKCIFCSFQHQQKIHYIRNRKKFNNEYLNVDYKGKKEIRLNADSFAPKTIKSFFNGLTIPNDIKHLRIFMRPTLAEYHNLKYIKTKVQISLGLEFPSERMWNYINKGYNYEDVSKVINHMSENTNFKLIVNIILGWNNLIPEDIINMRSFLLKLNYPSLTTFVVHNLFIFSGSHLMDDYPNIQDKITVGPFYMGYKPNISKEQLKLNKEAYQIIEHLKEVKNITIHDV